MLSNVMKNIKILICHNKGKINARCELPKHVYFSFSAKQGRRVEYACIGRPAG